MKPDALSKLRLSAATPPTRSSGGGAGRQIRVLVVDDSALMRSLLGDIINASSDMRVVAAAPDADRAWEHLNRLKPDVVTLDVEMPGINGLALLERVMREAPVPVVMISSYTESGSEATLKALELGAVDFLAKPRQVGGSSVAGYAEEVREKVRAAAAARPGAEHQPAPATTALRAAPEALDARVLRERVVCIGASTGGTEAIKEVLTRFPVDMPPILIVQHMPEMFTASFAKRLNDLSRIQVKEAEDGEVLKPGVAYLAPGHSHLMVRRNAGAYACVLSREAPVNRHRPSVDVLFNSAARELGAQALGVILTGMGKDGAQGMLAMRQAGAWNIAQDEASCVVWGMPREATLNGAAHEVSSLKSIATQVLARLKSAERRTIPS